VYVNIVLLNLWLILTKYTVRCVATLNPSWIWISYSRSDNHCRI